jgi:hypothetical protein
MARGVLPKGQKNRKIIKKGISYMFFLCSTIRMETNHPPLEPPPHENVAAPPATPPVALDAHGFDPGNYDWVPVLRKRRSDGWCPDTQRRFIEELADCGSVTQAAQSVGMSEMSCYRLRRSPGAEGFCAAWTAAIESASKRLVDAAFERALVGSDEPVFDRDGRRVGRRLRQSDRMLMFLLRAYMPDRFRHAAHDVRQLDEALLPTATPVARALELMLPETPANPHLLMEPDELDNALDVAEILDGKLPHWHRAPLTEIKRGSDLDVRLG